LRRAETEIDEQVVMVQQVTWILKKLEMTVKEPSISMETIDIHLMKLKFELVFELHLSQKIVLVESYDFRNISLSNVSKATE